MANSKSIYPRTGDTQTVYLKNVITRPNIEVGDYTMYNDFVNDPSSCDIAYTDNLEKFNADYLRYTTEVQGTCIDHDLSEEYMVIGTSAIVNVELDGAIGMNSGIFNNPFMIWGKYRIDGDKALLSISFQFHHTQMDGAHAGKFLKNLQEEIERMGETSV